MEPFQDQLSETPSSLNRSMAWHKQYPYCPPNEFHQGVPSNPMIRGIRCPGSRATSDSGGPPCSGNQLNSMESVSGYSEPSSEMANFEAESNLPLLRPGAVEMQGLYPPSSMEHPGYFVNNRYNQFYPTDSEEMRQAGIWNASSMYYPQMHDVPGQPLNSFQFCPMDLEYPSYSLKMPSRNSMSRKGPGFSVHSGETTLSDTGLMTMPVGINSIISQSQEHWMESRFSQPPAINDEVRASPYSDDADDVFKANPSLEEMEAFLSQGRDFFKELMVSSSSSSRKRRVKKKSGFQLMWESTLSNEEEKEEQEEKEELEFVKLLQSSKVNRKFLYLMINTPLNVDPGYSGELFNSRIRYENSPLTTFQQKTCVSAESLNEPAGQSRLSVYENGPKEFVEESQPVGSSGVPVQADPKERKEKSPVDPLKICQEKQNTIFRKVPLVFYLLMYFPGEDLGKLECVNKLLSFLIRKKYSILWHNVSRDCEREHWTNTFDLLPEKIRDHDINAYYKVRWLSRLGCLEYLRYNERAMEIKEKLDHQKLKPEKIFISVVVCSPKFRKTSHILRELKQHSVSIKKCISSMKALLSGFAADSPEYRFLSQFLEAKWATDNTDCSMYLKRNVASMFVLE